MTDDNADRSSSMSSWAVKESVSSWEIDSSTSRFWEEVFRWERQVSPTVFRCFVSVHNVGDEDMSGGPCELRFDW